jgi:hypothetical protein
MINRLGVVPGRGQGKLAAIELAGSAGKLADWGA